MYCIYLSQETKYTIIIICMHYKYYKNIIYLYKFNGNKDAECVHLSDIEVDIGSEAGQEHHHKEHHQKRNFYKERISQLMGKNTQIYNRPL